MNYTELQQTLETLHKELKSAASVDDVTRTRLETLAADIQRLAEQKSAEEPVETAESLAEQVQDSVLKFETEHPQLTRALNQVSAALANLGI